MPAVPHLESADPTEADDDDAVADDDEDDAAADNTPESRQDFTPSRTEREGMERKGTERDKAFSTRPANDYQSFWD